MQKARETKQLPNRESNNASLKSSRHAPVLSPELGPNDIHSFRHTYIDDLQNDVPNDSRPQIEILLTSSPHSTKAWYR